LKEMKNPHQRYFDTQKNMIISANSEIAFLSLPFWGRFGGGFQIKRV